MALSRSKLVDRIFDDAISQLPAIKALQSSYKLPEPQEGAPQIFYQSNADITIFGGAAGCSKSHTLLLKAAKNIHVPDYGAVIFRSTSPEITNTGGLWDESLKLYGKIPGAVNRESRLDWLFPTGASISFGHADKLQQKYPGAQITFMAVDELTTFSESDFWFLLSRNRSTCGIKPTLSATCNPDADSWVAKLVEWWIDQDTGYAIKERSGVVRYFYRVAEQMHWGESADELMEEFPKLAEIAPPKSITFIPGSIYENKALLKANPEYLSNLLALHPVLMERLLKGNWKVKMESGNVFRRDWFEIVDGLPDVSIRRKVRFWDFAATAQNRANKRSSFTASAKVYEIEGIYYICDITAVQVSAEDGNKAVLSTARQDGVDVSIRWELEGGSAALRYESTLKNVLAGFSAKGIKPMGDKKTRALSWATIAAQGRVRLVRSPWNDIFLSACSQFDGSSIPMVTDVIDAVSGAIAELEQVGKLAYTSSGSAKKR